MEKLEPTRLSASTIEDNDDVEEEEQARFKWINIIFLPFNPIFQFIVMICVIMKCVLGPLQMVYPFINCSDVMDSTVILAILKYFYLYVCDIIYIIDTFLYIVHRQVQEEAMKREYLPKSGLHLFFDMLALIPFFRFVSVDLCPQQKLWPNILGFFDMFCIYRVVQYFSLYRTHSLLMMFLGYSIFMMLMINCVSCIFLLWTFQGLCGVCTKDKIVDWRVVLVKNKILNDQKMQYFYAIDITTSFFVSHFTDIVLLNTMNEFILATILTITSYLISTFLIQPKLFADGLLKSRRISEFQPRANRVIGETKRRNYDLTAYTSVAKYYRLCWKYRRGITSIPTIINEVPNHMKQDIILDLSWAIFHHSPTFRRTSTHFKKWISKYISLESRLPGELFFTGPQTYASLCYLKSGIVQLLSADDVNTALLSVTGGTIFGDVSFVLPIRRKVIVRCLTYCEVFLIDRKVILRGLHKFPKDRWIVMNLVDDRIRHGRALFKNKQQLEKLQVLSRSETEGIAWIKRRWWQISSTFAKWKRNKTKHLVKELPPEEAAHHCCKYIGQLVLCSDVQLERQTMFVKLSFPWILLPHSAFGCIWNQIVLTSVYLVLLLYPPNITKRYISPWFLWFQFLTDVIYVMDVMVSMITSVKRKHAVITDLAGIILARLMTPFFILDILATPWIDVVLSQTKYFPICQFNRLLKIYMLFYQRYQITWYEKLDPALNIMFIILLQHFCIIYISSYFIYMLKFITPNLKLSVTKKIVHALQWPLIWAMKRVYLMWYPATYWEKGLRHIKSFLLFFIYIYSRTQCVSVLYLKTKDLVTYHLFVSNLKKHYIRQKIHPALLKRLESYLNCQWKYYNGMDILHKNVLSQEPFDIYWKLHGEVAEKIIGGSELMAGANPLLVTDLARTAKYLVVPKNTILYLFGVECKYIGWVVNGFVKCEYHNDNSELLTSYCTTGQMLSISALFLGKCALSTYTADSECEILIIKNTEFYHTVKRYANEQTSFQKCLEQFTPIFDKMFYIYIRKNKVYQKKLRNEMFRTNETASDAYDEPSFLMKVYTFLHTYRENPESTVMKIWMPFRAATVAVSIASSSLQGGIGAQFQEGFQIIHNICDVINLVDVLIKFFLPYYDERGLIITNIRKCFIHYVTRGFILDIISIIPFYIIFINFLGLTSHRETILLVQTACNFSTLYLITGYFNYLCDTPNGFVVFLMVFKWQIILLLMMFGASHLFIAESVTFVWNQNGDLEKVLLKKNHWLPPAALTMNSAEEFLNNIFLQSVILAQCASSRVIMGMFTIYTNKISLIATFLGICVLAWYIKCNNQMLLLLHFRGSAIYQHGVEQLEKFMMSERLEQPLINRTVSYFTYYWLRTKGLNLHLLMSERLSIMFKQELNLFFYRRTLEALDTVLRGGDSLLRDFSGFLSLCYYTPEEDIMREMDLTRTLFIVHRGRVRITKDGHKVTFLTQGCIFGQLDSPNARPSRVTAVADDYVDCLEISLDNFHSTITDKIRTRINKVPDSVDDFIKLPKTVQENARNTVQFLIRGQKTIKLPWMLNAVEARSNAWYSRWLVLAWILAPGITVIIVAMMYIVPPSYLVSVLWFMLPLDLIHLANFISEFFTMELEIENNKCVYKYRRLKLLATWGFYLDILSFIIPLFTTFTKNWHYQVARWLRVHTFYSYNRHLSRIFQTGKKPILLKFGLYIVIIHTLTCGWINFYCREDLTAGQSRVNVLNNTFDPEEWTYPRERPIGCFRLKYTYTPKSLEKDYLVPKNWRHDYIISLFYILTYQIHLNIDVAIPLTNRPLVYKIVVSQILALVDLWISTVTISAIYTKLREMCKYNFEMRNLMTYLKHNEISDAMLRFLTKYLDMLWSRQKGTWLPNITKEAPFCLQQDILSSLYMHHLLAHPLFRNHLPMYVLRQLATRLQRRVIFPGQLIIEEGDISDCVFFIHEGEVEKWHLDSKGENRFVTLLSINGYFGVVPGLFPNSPFEYSYYSRSVVDLVYLHFGSWQDILNGYPDIKKNLYKAAFEIVKSNHH